MIIRDLSELSRADLPIAGGKGANLGELIRLGLAVPPGFVVTAETYAEQARAWQLAEQLAAPIAASNWEVAAATAAELCLRGALLPAVELAVRDAYRELGAPLVAVRSSATAEDLADASFAGQHETYLQVEGESALLLALRRCWASLWTPRALGYRAARSIDHLGVAIAVVVQRMVQSEFAGVLFTVDPVDQRTDRMLVELAPGLGEAIVSGHTSGDIYHLSRPPDAGEPGADAPAITDRARRVPGRPAPSDALVRELARIGLRLEAHFGCPQDVEFAFAGGVVHLLQSRPITTLREVELETIPPLPPLSRMQRRMLESNDNDRFPVAPKPLDQWGFGMVMPALAHTLRFAGFAVDETELRVSIDQVWREVLVPPRARPTLRLLALPRTVAASLRHDWTGWWENEALPRILDVCGPADLGAMDDTALLRRADRIGDVLTETLGKRFEGIVGQAATLLLRIPVVFAVGKKRAPALMGDLVSGLRTRTSEVNAALFDLSRKAVGAGPQVTRPLREGRPDELRESEAGRAFLAEVDAFLAEHGYRESTGLFLSATMWRRDPTPLWGLLRGLLDAAEPPSEAAGLRRYRAALAEVTRALRFIPGLGVAFERIVERLRTAIVFRERSHFDLARLFSALQDIIAELGRRLHERGHLPVPEDIFYLTQAELRIWLAGQVPPRSEIEQLVRRRRATYAVVNGRWQKWSFAVGRQDGATDVLRGVGASSGVVRGKARVIRDEHEFERLRAGEILVCPYTNPAWTPLFTLAAGVVTNTGGAVSHAAIVAREYGIPAVLGAAGATGRIADGQEILVDGNEGLVTLLRSASASEAAHG
ncbi:PEP/pyruvate-binding domain-containing protein [Nannocystis sp. SCPEA4]|uniref:PEP/pyruvate-binding domain-containing protein n=1 Tax=Nannocystis sp. SCPEA4 TaxID=2996787 RepID=UPI00226DC379|nr:PEP/pyruvate-binding domain-containing protein [Nannocystis sp. SCPEA4]MCY1054792.1 PEP-utilizing enzyme [Nannocystis sp. SCPEA4]